MIDQLFSGNRPGIDWRRFFSSPLVLVVMVTAISIFLGFRIARGGQNVFIDLVTLAGGGVLLWIAFNRPVWGLAFTLASLPILDLVEDLSPSLPLINSISTALGAVTLGGFIISARWNPEVNYRFRLHPQYVWAALFIGWAIATNPNAAILVGTRNWLWTLVQLALLLFLVSVLLQSPRDHQIVMACFAIMATFSAAAVIISGDVARQETLGGLTAGANTAARYLLTGFIFWVYLRQNSEKSEVRLFCLLAALITLVGIAFTGSRTGLFLIFVILLFLFLDNHRPGLIWFVFPILLISALAVIILPDSLFTLSFSTPDSIQQGSDTINMRFLLWEAGWRMFTVSPIQGIGIGQYPLQLINYGADLLPPDKLAAGAHNSYVAVLTETGLVGLVLFMGLQLTSLLSLWRVYRSNPSSMGRLALTWLLVLLVFMIGGLTKHDHYEKMLWAAVGVGTGMAVYLQLGTEKSTDF